ncbi:MAG: acyl-CoA dehydrogenase family protein [Pseudomonadota bacterium]
MTAAALTVAPLLEQIAAGAASADVERSVDRGVIDAIKANPVMRMTAAESIAGSDASSVAVAAELAAVAAACSSTAWCLWNHLCTFHLFCGLLGPENADQLRGITERAEWVCFPAGAGTASKGELDGGEVVITGQAAFGSGGRYADYAGASFRAPDSDGVAFALVDLHQAEVRIDPTWRAMSLRASATDDVHYAGARVDAARVVAFPFRYREVFRDPERDMIHPRYREDWVALSDLWLGAMAAGVAQAALDEVCDGIRERVAIAGVKVAERPTVHVNLGQAQAAISAARDTVDAACRETDARIAARQIPTETDYLRQMAAGMQALRLCDDAMRLLLRIQGGNGLREGTNFERRYRDFQAMPLHINAHPDRVTEQYGRALLGLATENPF